MIKSGAAEFVFTTPERLANPEFAALLKSLTIDLLVIDEAHCISQWGHDFRPAYLELRERIRELHVPSVLALTATARPDVIEDIRAGLGLADMKVIDFGTYRPNLAFEVRHVTNESEKRAHVIELVQQNRGSGAVYTATVKEAESLANYLADAGIAVEKYHGKMPPRERKAAQERFMSGTANVMVATNAFGMGIDKSDLRFVIHYQIPGSLEAYYQEAGRAGRDGEAARCILLFDLNDKRTQQFFLGGRYPGAQDVYRVYRVLQERQRDGRETTLTALVEAARPLAKPKLQVALAALRELKIVKLMRASGYRAVQDFTRAALEALANTYILKADSDRQKLEQMMQYAQSMTCRWRQILEYFDEKAEFESCGSCDVCRQPPLEPEGSTAAETGIKSGGDSTEWAIGDRISTPQHGVAKIESLENEIIVARLRNGEVKRFHRDFVTHSRAK